MAGHALANLTVRTLALHPNFALRSIATTLGIDRALFTPKSADRKAWTSLTAQGAQAMSTAASQLGCTELVDLTRALEAIALDPAVDALKQLRNDQYHRWRGESPGVTGVNFNDESMHTRLERGEAVGLGRELLPNYVEGQAVIDELVLISREALDGIVVHLSTFLATWDTAFVAATR